MNITNIIKPLSQDDLSMGWILVTPRVKKIKNPTPDDNKRTTNIHHSKVNLAQLPYNLWHKVNNRKWIHDNSHIYHYEVTNVDGEIRDLVNVLNKPFDIINKDYIKSLITVITDNNVTGWPIIKARRMYR